MIQKMGSIKDLLAKMPGMGDMMPPGVNIDDGELARIEAIIQCFTSFERKDPYALIREPGARRRASPRAPASPSQQVQELVQKFLFMKQMMGGLGQNMGMMGKIPGMKNLAMAKQPAKADGAGRGVPGHARHGDAGDGDARNGLPRMGMPGMGMPGMGMPGMGMPGESMTKMRTMSAAEKNAKKAQSKREKEARKKSRR